MLMPSDHAATEVMTASGSTLLSKAISGSVVIFMASVSTESLDTCAEPALPFRGPGMADSDLHRILLQESWS